MPEPNDVTLGELGRRFDTLREDLREDLAQVRDELNRLGDKVETKTVGVDLYKVRHSALEERIGLVERHLDRTDDQIEAARTARRFIWISLAVAGIAFLGSAISGLAVALIH